MPSPGGPRDRWKQQQDQRHALTLTPKIRQTRYKTDPKTEYELQACKASKSYPYSFFAFPMDVFLI